MIPAGALRNEPRDAAFPISGRSDAAGARYGGKFGQKKSDSGTARSGTWETGASGTARPWCPLRAHLRCAASPCCRTCRNARSRRSLWAPPRHKSANRSRGTARAAGALPRPGSPAHCACGSGEDCRCGTLDKSISFSPGNTSAKNTRSVVCKASSICGRLICCVQYWVWALLGAQDQEAWLPLEPTLIDIG